MMAQVDACWNEFPIDPLRFLIICAGTLCDPSGAAESVCLSSCRLSFRLRCFLCFVSYSLGAFDGAVSYVNG